MPQDFETGIEALRNGDTTTAIAALERATREDSTNYEALAHLGSAYVQAGRHSEAAHVLLQAVQLRPSDARARYNFGVALQKAGWNDQAKTAYEQALTLQPDYLQAQQALATLAPQQRYAPQTPPNLPPMPPPTYAPTAPSYAPLPIYQNQPPPAPYYGQTNVPTAPYMYNVNDFQNTSGMNADVPYEVATCRWNWGAFLWSWIWLMGHGMVGWGLLALLANIVPGGGIAVSIYLGIDGHKLAWKNRRFSSLEDFFRVQTRWAWGWLIMAGVFFMVILPLIISMFTFGD